MLELAILLENYCGVAEPGLAQEFLAPRASSHAQDEEGGRRHAGPAAATAVVVATSELVAMAATK